jgi:hypothetical protein
MNFLFTEFCLSTIKERILTLDENFLIPYETDSLEDFKFIYN